MFDDKPGRRQRSFELTGPRVAIALVALQEDQILQPAGFPNRSIKDPPQLSFIEQIDRPVPDVAMDFWRPGWRVPAQNRNRMPFVGKDRGEDRSRSSCPADDQAMNGIHAASLRIAKGIPPPV